MIELQTLQCIWFFLVGAVLCIYASTAGFDFGATMINPFMQNETDRRLLLNAVGPTWDGNQTWIVFAGGALFIVYPSIYATVFSGLYAAMLVILWSFFLRPPGFDYRSKIESMVWKRMWDWALFISAFFPVFVFGVAFGNFMVGLPFQFDPITLRMYYGGNFWGLLNQFSILCGIISVVLFITHGAAYLTRRTEGDLRVRMYRVHKIFAGLLVILLTVAALMVSFQVKGYVLLKSPVNALAHPLTNIVARETGAWVHSYGQYPWKIVGPILAYVGIIASMLTPIKKGTFLFWSSVVGVCGTVMTAGFNLFPFIVPSSTHMPESYTVWNSTSTYYTLKTMLWIAVTCLLIILVYKIYAYWTIWHQKPTIDEQDLKERGHESY